MEHSIFKQKKYRAIIYINTWFGGQKIKFDFFMHILILPTLQAIQSHFKSKQVATERII